MLTKLQKIFLSYPKLKERIDSRDNPKLEQEKALKNLDEIKAEYSKTYIKTFEKMLDATLPNLYDGINFNENGHDFKKLVKENCVVLVPNHQSHADYLAINYIVYKTFGFPLYVAGGINLNIFPIGKLFRKSGCFFIRRSFASDILYKLSLEAYLYCLLIQKKPIEFFFEGGRSRTGKLLPPRFGLYQMLLEAHSHIPEKDKAKLLFCPVSINHEYVPETKSLARELKGAKKVKESSGQLLGLLKFLSYQFGNVHITLGSPIEAKKNDDVILKDTTYELAFNCFRQVGKRMVVTPTALLSLILLDEPAGAMQWNEILSKAKKILEYCALFEVPFTDSLKGEQVEDTLGRAVDILIGNKKLNVIGKNKSGHVFYSIKEESRQEMLYFKNTILHHFLVPWTINLAWINLFSGNLNTVDDLKKFFLNQRSQMKHEFYLPTVREFFMQAVQIVSKAIGRKVETIEDLMNLSHKELYAIASFLSPFSRSLSYINEAYYVSALTLKELGETKPEGFKGDDYFTLFKENFNSERDLGKIIKFQESYSQPLMKNSLKYFTQESYAENDKGLYKITNREGLEKKLTHFESDLKEQLKFNLRAD